MSSARSVLPVLLGCVLAASAVGCTGSVVSGECAPAVGGNEPPLAPAILAPIPGVPAAAPAQFTVALSPYEDPEGDDHAATEVEIWRVVAGELVERVWRARVEPPDDLLRIPLAAGLFENSAVTAGLAEWTDHVVRARFVDASGTCSAGGAWSEATFRTDDGSAYLFDPDRVYDMRLTIPPDSLAAIDAEARPPGCVPFSRSYHPGTFEFEGQVFAGAGMRSKGGCGSSRHINGKTAFKINLSYDDPNADGCPETRRLHGLKRITLNNMVQDRTQLHESLGYRLYKAMGVPTPRTAYVQLTVNDQPWGLYLHVETIDRRFLDRRFDSKEGMLYEGTYWCDLLPANMPAGPEDDSGCFSRKFKTDACSDPVPAGGDPRTYEPLIALVDAIEALPAGGFYPAIEDTVEFDTFLSSWSVDSVMAHWDGYEFSIMNNYRVYHDPGTDRWTVIPTGIDQTFNNNRDVDPFAVSGVLARRCLEEPACRAAFEARLAEAVETFAALDLGGAAQQLRALITPYVEADPRREMDLGTFNARADELLQWIAGRPDVMRAKLP